MSLSAHRRNQGSTRKSLSVILIACLCLSSIASASPSTFGGDIMMSYALRTDHTLWAWGSFLVGPLGPNVEGGSDVPVQVVDYTDIIAASSGNAHMVIVRENGTVWAWGFDGWGQIGQGKPSPEDGFYDDPVQVDGISEIIDVSAGVSHNLVINSNGEIWGWGLNGSGQIGIGTDTDVYTAEKIDLNNVIDISAGWTHSLALRQDGTVWAWGANSLGQLGDGTQDEQWEPQQVSGLTDIVAISACYHSLALSANGEVWMWGITWTGDPAEQGTQMFNPTPVAGLNGVIDIADGASHSMALKADGTVWTWGMNENGQLGDGTTDDSFTPVQVANLTDVVAIASGDYHCLAVKEDGTLWAWGMGGPIGDGSNEDQLVPVQVLTGVMIDPDASPDELWVSNYTGVTDSVVSTMIWKSDLKNGATVELKNGETVVVEADVYYETGGYLTATFDLTGVDVGEYDLIITNTDEQELTAPESFVVEAEKNIDLHLDILARDAIRVDQPQTFTVLFSNRGNVDAVGVPLFISGIPSDATFEPLFDIGLPPEFTFSDMIDYSEIPTTLEINDEIYLPLFVPVIYAGDTQTYQFRITMHSEQQFQIRAWTGQPLFSSPLKTSWEECLKVIGKEAFAKLPPVIDCALAMDELGEKFFEFQRPGGASLTSFFYLVTATLNAGVQCGGEAFAPYTLGGSMLVEGVADALIILMTATDPKCLDALMKTADAISNLISSVLSIDPNDKASSTDGTEDGFFAGDQPLSYAVFFENLESASAAAREVVITDQLDTESLDLSTLELGIITFGETTVSPPPGQSSYTTDVDLRPDQDILVHIEVSLNQSTGVLTWAFSTLDPETSEPPDDPLAGFLPPNVTSPEGEGSVLFTVMAKQPPVSGTVITNQASIVFDTNEAIETSEVTNTIDNNAPASEVDALSSTQRNTQFTVSWSGTDNTNGSGIRDYTIYVGIDGADAETWLVDTTETSATYTGERGHTYSFYSIATDNVGNVEAMPDTPDVTTTISTSSSNGSSGQTGGMCGFGAPAATFFTMGILLTLRLHRRR